MAQSTTEAFRFPTAENHDAPLHQDGPLTKEPTESALESSRRLENARARSALRTGLIAGAGASVLSTAALMLAGRHETGSAVAPTNATSHWLWGNESLAADRATLRHTALGYLTHHLAATFWATLYAWLYGNRRSAQSIPAALAGATAAAAVSCVVDYTVTPERLRPGFEHRLSKPAMSVMYGAFALGLAAGCLLANRR